MQGDGAGGVTATATDQEEFGGVGDDGRVARHLRAVARSEVAVVRPDERDRVAVLNVARLAVRGDDADAVVGAVVAASVCAAVWRNDDVIIVDVLQGDGVAIPYGLSDRGACKFLRRDAPEGHTLRHSHRGHRDHGHSSYSDQPDNLCK